MGRTTRIGLLAVAFLLFACQAGGAPAPTTGGSRSSSSEPQARSSEPKTMVMAVRYEADGLARKATNTRGTNATLRVFNAQLTYVDGKGDVNPYLLESLPGLNTDAWRVGPDGKMDVTYRLRPNLTWHDGQPLTSDDFVFAYDAYTAPGIDIFSPRPQNFMDKVEASDPRTFTIRWNALYPDATNFLPGDFEPLPRHILGDLFHQVQQDPVAGLDAFRNSRYWTQEYVGAGPFKLDHWEPGTELVSSAFDGHALGRPKIDRVIVRIFADENTVLSNLVSESVDLATDFTLRYEHGKILTNDWETTKRGVVLFFRGGFDYTIVQMRPEAQKSPEMLDLRVRKAIAYGIDRDSLNEGQFDGRGFPADASIPADVKYYPELDRAIAHYPYDPRRTEQLMLDYGFVKDAGGFFASPGGERFRPDFWMISGPLFEAQQAIMAETWAKAGLEVVPRLQSPAMLRDNQASATFSGMSTRVLGGGESDLPMYTTAQIGTPANRWQGNNRGGWISPELDQLYEQYKTTLDRSERDRQVISMIQLVSEQLPIYPIYFSIDVMAHLSKIHGPAAGVIGRLDLWNIHEWEMSS